MISANPFAEFRSVCENTLKNALALAFPNQAISSSLDSPPNPEYGELSSSVSFELAKATGKTPIEIAKEIARQIDLSSTPILASVKAAGNGYVNFHVNMAILSEITLNSIRTFGKEYGYVKTEKPARIIVEHTSANPVHPIHIGTARNPVLGDALVRILTARGHTVYRHFYVDDVGRQVSVTAFGYGRLGEPKPDGKPDHFLGAVYAVTSCIVEIQKLKSQIENAKDLPENEEELRRLHRELDEWVTAASELESRHPGLFRKLLDEISKYANPDEQISGLNHSYERGEDEAKRLVRKVTELCLDGFKQTLTRAGVVFDAWDWESDVVWSSNVQKILKQLQKTPYVLRMGEVLEFGADDAVQELGLRSVLGIRQGFEVPPLTLVRADGTTLYTTRDIAYNLLKLQQADQAISVIGMEQTLAQVQLKVALCALGYIDKAKALRHFAYNLVRLPGYKMSGRTGRYITLDETIDEAVRRAYEEVGKRSPELSMDEKKSISDIVGIGAIKYALIQVDPAKPVMFTWDRVLDFQRNSAPYIQYSYARAGSILRKAERASENADYSLLKEPVEHDLVLTLAQFPDLFIDSAENLRPNQIADYANGLADKFNTFYNALPVIKANPLALSDARLSMTSAIRTVLGNALNLLGIEAPEKM